MYKNFTCFRKKKNLKNHKHQRNFCLEEKYIEKKKISILNKIKNSIKQKFYSKPLRKKKIVSLSKVRNLKKESQDLLSLTKQKNQIDKNYRSSRKKIKEKEII